MSASKRPNLQLLVLVTIMLSAQLIQAYTNWSVGAFIFLIASGIFMSEYIKRHRLPRNLEISIINDNYLRKKMTVHHTYKDTDDHTILGNNTNQHLKMGDLINAGSRRFQVSRSINPQRNDTA